MVQECLDRAFASRSWLEVNFFASYLLCKLPSLQAFVSDRSPILLECDCSNKWIWLGQFHFENFLLSHLSIFQIVQSAWNETVGQGAKDRLAFCASQL